MITLDPHQEKAVGEGLQIMRSLGYLVLNMATRTGKTFTTFEIIKRYGFKNVLFIAPKKALKEIMLGDYLHYENDFECTFINPESLHKVKGDFDLAVYDEYHGFGYIQKQKLITKRFAKYAHLPRIALTGTLFPETLATAYSLFDFEFKECASFYTWYNDYGQLEIKKMGNMTIRDYKGVKNDRAIRERINKYIVTCDQEEAQFVHTAVDVPVHLDLPDHLKFINSTIKKDKIAEVRGYTFVADTASKEFQSRLQIDSGCLKIDDTRYVSLDNFKCDWIRKNFYNEKIAIFYNYIGEKYLIEQYFSEYRFTDDPIEFRASLDQCIFLCHFKSGREGIKLESAKTIIFFSCPHSYTSYHQARDRMTLRNSKVQPKIHILLAGMQAKVYKSVAIDKKNFNLDNFRSFSGKEVKEKVCPF